MTKNRPTPGWATWQFCLTADTLIEKLSPWLDATWKTRFEIVPQEDGSGFDLYTYEEEIETASWDA